MSVVVALGLDSTFDTALKYVEEASQPRPCSGRAWVLPPPRLVWSVLYSIVRMSSGVCVLIEQGSWPPRRWRFRLSVTSSLLRISIVRGRIYFRPGFDSHIVS